MTGNRRSSYTRAPFAPAVAHARRALVARHTRGLLWLRANRGDLVLIASAILLLTVVPLVIAFGLEPTN